MSQKQADLAQLFGFLSDAGLGLDALIERYLGYHGSLHFGHQTLLVASLRRAASLLDEPTAARLGHRDVLWADGRIAPAFLERFAPRFTGAYYDAGSDAAFERACMLPASRNEWCSTDLPAPLNIRLGQAERPEIAVLFGAGRRLFVSAYGYQWFDPDAGCFWPLAASRALPRSIEGYRHVDVEAPVAVIQDQFDGANFCHFLYDNVPRVLYLAELFPEFARRCRFVMGGEPGPYQALILRRICERHGLAAGQFVFPREPEIWRLGGGVAFFSDQMTVSAHPLHMCHPRTLRLVRDLLDGGGFRSDGPARVYVSRADAGTRPVLNEPALQAALAGAGYVAVRLSEHDATTQIGILAHASHVVAPHGMGLANLLFNRRLGSLLEIFNERIGTDAYAFVAHALGIEYRFSLGADQDDGRFGTLANLEEVMSLATALDPRHGQPRSSATALSAADKDRPPATGNADVETLAAPSGAKPPAMLSDTELVQQFESLGDNCEFGLVQRFVGAEPLGFFRFNYASLPALKEMLDTEFRDLDCAEDIELVRAAAEPDAELIVRNKRFHYRYHTFRHDLDAGPVRAQQLRVISFLKDKLISDLRAGEKIFVRRGAHSVEQVGDLVRRLRRYGPATLLWVVPEDEANPAGTVRVLDPGLLQGFMDRLAPPQEAYDLSPVWVTVCRGAYALRVGGCAPGTIITPPRGGATTNLLRRAHVGPNKVDWWVSEGSEVAEAGADAPARLHPESPVSEHRLTADTVWATSPLCGVNLQHGLAPGTGYVASMHVWIPEGAAFEQVGAVFRGTPATRYQAADMAQRNRWQRVWVAARAASSDSRMNPSLFALGKAGARLYATAWQLEIGHTPSPYRPNTSGTLPNRGPSAQSFRARTPAPARAG
jgi:hypothetical protein